ncbi:hypothetical protein D3273_17895 [Lichenibacterium minor]|uniref:DUF680 domain-containing protein n=1 Tax=Lichenibacterium minor TaxID=2316528 RepID=A0A4Q2U256_9HYPH|nr:hypothetical protein [Lichenibacterium minor]RYC30563.1 hypothetical protein D3273_17895 [Lichenibacterium minor]
MRNLIAVVLTLSTLSGGALAQDAAPAEAHKGALPQPVGTTQVQQPAGVTRTGDAQGKSGNTASGVNCQSASAEMTNGKVETCAK